MPGIYLSEKAVAPLSLGFYLNPVTPDYRADDRIIDRPLERDD